jgi:hypothetical protein
VDKPRFATGIAFAILVTALVALLTPRTARADEERSPDLTRPAFTIEADLRYAWVARPPGLTLYEPGKYGSRIDGIRDGFVGGDTPLQGVGAHFGLVYHPTRNLIVPTLGVTFGGATGGYGTTTRDDGLSFSPDSLSYFATLDLIGLGLEARRGPITVSASARAGVDYFAVSGQLTDPQLAADATGKGWALAIRGELRLCGRVSDDGVAHVCIFGGPTLVEGSHTMNGGYAGLGATF